MKTNLKIGVELIFYRDTVFLRRISIFVLVTVYMLLSGISFAEDRSTTSIFDYKNELSITDSQEKNLRDILAKLQEYIEAGKKELNALRSELKKMMADKADLSGIKEKVYNIARVQADATYEDIASIRAIEKELTDEQMAKWRVIQEDFKRKQQQDEQVAAAGVTGIRDIRKE